MFWRATGVIFLCALTWPAGCSDSDDGALSIVNGTQWPCEDPAPLLGEPTEELENSYFVCCEDGVDVAEEAARLAEKYGFTPRCVYGIITLPRYRRSLSRDRGGLAVRAHG